MADMTTTDILNRIGQLEVEIRKLRSQLKPGTPSKVLGLSTRTYAALYRAEYRTVESIIELLQKEGQVWSVRNFSYKSQREVTEKLKSHGYIG